MPKTHVSRSVQITASVDKIFNTLNNFNHWSSWSPWLICEPDARVSVSPDAKYYEWKGKRIGSGNMRIINEQSNSSIDYDLTFLKPWKSTAKVRFELNSSGEQTSVNWIMDSSLPFFMFWMKRTMETMVGLDFDRGLNMLKEYVEDGAITSRLEFIGQGHYPGCQYLGINRTCDMSEVGKLMSADFQRLWDYMGEDTDNIKSAPFSIYHKWDMGRQKVSYTSGVPLKSLPTEFSEGMITGTIPATSTFTLRHIGPYLHLGNAWSTLIAMQRAKEFKPRKGLHPFETYENHPGEVPDTELITDIHFGLKS